VVPAVNQIEVHPTLAQFDLIAVNDELGIATEAWSPLGRKADLDNEVIVRIAERQGKSPAQVILRWHIQRGNIVFPKSQNPDRLKQNFDIFDFELSDDDVLAIDGIGGENRVGPDPETFNRH
jgi:2,5-diketo-D-gluconate reductase A